jgi:hypothetical protein
VAYADAFEYYSRLPREERILRRLLWLRHGHDGLYGDDGEMQCARCRLDFLRDSVEVIDQAFERQALERLRKLAEEA